MTFALKCFILTGVIVKALALIFFAHIMLEYRRTPAYEHSMFSETFS
jgi:hypothetical protein